MRNAEGGEGGGNGKVKGRGADESVAKGLAEI
jgi:hypothetical protein